MDLNEEFVKLLEDNNINNRYDYFAYSVKHKEECYKFAGIYKTFFESANLFGSEKGSHKKRDFLSKEEFSNLMAKEGIKTKSQYTEFRTRLSEEGNLNLLHKLPFYAEEFYSTKK